MCLGLPARRQRYAFFTNANGGVIDDLMIAHCGDRFVLVVNASRKVADEAHLRAAMSQVCTIEVLEDRALLALQGPEAESALARLAPDSAAMRFMDVRSLAIAGSACLVTRSGYTGEDGFEISVAASEAEKLARVFLENASVAFAGLGARDSLRTEAGLCLYGSDLDENTTPVEAALEWAIQKVRRRGGARPGGFPGADVVLRQLDDGPPRRRVGLRPQGRMPVRGGALLFAAPVRGRTHRRGHVRWLRTFSRRPRRHGLRAARSLGARHARVRRSARQSHSSRSDRSAVHSASLQPH